MAGGGSKPGERRGGRQAGTPNRATQSLLERFQARDCDPIDRMIDLIEDESVEVGIRARLIAEAVQYLHPKRKAIEIKDDTAGKSDFLQVREMLAAYREWKREQGLPLAGALPDQCPTTPYVSPPEWVALRAKLHHETPQEEDLVAEPVAPAPATSARAAQTNGSARPAQRGNGQGRREI